MLTLAVQERDMKTKAGTLRKQGVVPAVLYGPKEASKAVSIEGSAFERTWNQAGGSSIVVLQGVGEDKEVLIHSVDVHPVTGHPQHVDFYVIERGKKLTVSIPIEFVGEAPAEKEGHIISKAMYEIEIEVRPRDLPQHLDVDISSLKEVGDHITVADIKLPEDAEALHEADEIVASVKEAVEIPDEGPETVAAEVAAEGDDEAAEGGADADGDGASAADEEVTT